MREGITNLLAHRQGSVCEFEGDPEPECKSCEKHIERIFAALSSDAETEAES